MAKPVGVGRALKDNSNKHPQQRDEWNEGKRIGRKKQVWVEDFVAAVPPAGARMGTVEGDLGHGTGTISGHWEKV